MSNRPVGNGDRSVGNGDTHQNHKAPPPVSRSTDNDAPAREENMTIRYRSILDEFLSIRDFTVCLSVK